MLITTSSKPKHKKQIKKPEQEINVQKEQKS